MHSFNLEDHHFRATVWQHIETLHLWPASVTSTHHPIGDANVRSVNLALDHPCHVIDHVSICMPSVQPQELTGQWALWLQDVASSGATSLPKRAAHSSALYAMILEYTHGVIGALWETQ